MTSADPRREGAVAGSLLGDSPDRSFADKLERFNRFAAPELRALIAGLPVAGDADRGQRPLRALDAGCGAGLLASWLLERMGPGGSVVGIDLAHAHVDVARRLNSDPALTFLQGDITALPHAPVEAGSLDLVWCSNTINHLRDPLAGVHALGACLRPGGMLALGQSGMLPDLIFAWDERLERRVNDAVRRYYRDKYAISEQDTTSVRRLVGLLRDAGCQQVTPRTVAIERIAPLSAVDATYLLGMFEGYWGERLRPYLSAEDFDEVARLTDPDDPAFCLHRPDFHHVQTYTLVSGVYAP